MDHISTRTRSARIAEGRSPSKNLTRNAQNWRSTNKFPPPIQSFKRPVKVGRRQGLPLQLRDQIRDHRFWGDGKYPKPDKDGIRQLKLIKTGKFGPENWSRISPIQLRNTSDVFKKLPISKFNNRPSVSSPFKPSYDKLIKKAVPHVSSKTVSRALGVAKTTSQAANMIRSGRRAISGLARQAVNIWERETIPYINMGNPNRPPTVITGVQQAANMIRSFNRNFTRDFRAMPPQLVETLREGTNRLTSIIGNALRRNPSRPSLPSLGRTVITSFGRGIAGKIGGYLSIFNLLVETSDILEGRATFTLAHGFRYKTFDGHDPFWDQRNRNPMVAVLKMLNEKTNQFAGKVFDQVVAMWDYLFNTAPSEALNIDERPAQRNVRRPAPRPGDIADNDVFGWAKYNEDRRKLDENVGDKRTHKISPTSGKSTISETNDPYNPVPDPYYVPEFRNGSYWINPKKKKKRKFNSWKYNSWK